MTSAEPRHGFRITLDNFEGPFDLLLQLIGRHQLDIAEVALSQVTDEFIAYVKDGGEGWDLEQTSSFLVVAATLLDLKAARLLPSGDVDDPEDLAVLEARDLLFARLLQYRAYKRVSAWFADRMAADRRCWPPARTPINRPSWSKVAGVTAVPSRAASARTQKMRRESTSATTAALTCGSSVAASAYQAFSRSPSRYSRKWRAIPGCCSPRASTAGVA